MNKTRRVDELIDWIDGKKNPIGPITKESGINYLEDFFDDKDPRNTFVGQSKPRKKKPYVNPQIKSEDIQLFEQHNLGRVLFDLSGHVSNSINNIVANPDITNQEELTHLDHEVPKILKLLSEASLATKGSYNSGNIIDNYDGEITLRIIENQDHFEVIDPITQTTLYNINIINGGPNCPVTSVKISNAFDSITFNLEITSSRREPLKLFRISFIATDSNGQALDPYAENPMSIDQETTYRNMVYANNIESAFKSFTSLLSTGYYSENIDTIFNSKNPLQ